MGKYRFAFFSIIIVLLIPIIANAAGGDGAKCNPSTDSWPNCSLENISIREKIISTKYIPSGHYSNPYIADQANTEYILQGDITADSTAITINDNYIIINLNGYTITYNQKYSGEGVNIGNWNVNNIAVTNGAIIQGTAMSEGDQHGIGNNPIGSHKSGTVYGSNYFQIANLYLRYGGKDVGGIIIPYSKNTTVEQCTIEDTYKYGTLKNRHQGIDAVGTGSTQGIIRNNTIVNARQRGIQIDNNSEVYGNSIGIRSIATNSFGIFGYAKANVTVHDNTIIARGEHPIGIGFVAGGTDGIEIFKNYIDAQTTAIGEEYGGNSSCFNSDTPCGNYAVGFRTTWGGDNINFHNNEIHIKTDSSYNGTYSPTGESVVVNGKGRGLMVGISAGESSTFSQNTISVLDKDGTGEAYGISCVYNFSDGLFIIGNTVTSNISNIVLGDEYEKCDGFPLIAGNLFIKSGDFDRYATISNQLNGYYLTTGRIVSNTYQNGASVDAVNFHPSGYGAVSVYFGKVVDGKYLYDYRLHDNNNSSSVLLRDNFIPPKTFSKALPDGQLPDNPQDSVVDEPQDQLTIPPIPGNVRISAN